jgi:hypothetical protein
LDFLEERKSQRNSKKELTEPNGFDNLEKFAQNVVSFGATRGKVRKQAEVELVESGIGPEKSKTKSAPQVRGHYCGNARLSP